MLLKVKFLPPPAFALSLPPSRLPPDVRAFLQTRVTEEGELRTWQGLPLETLPVSVPPEEQEAARAVLSWARREMEAQRLRDQQMQDLVAWVRSHGEAWGVPFSKAWAECRGADPGLAREVAQKVCEHLAGAEQGWQLFSPQHRDPELGLEPRSHPSQEALSLLAHVQLLVRLVRPQLPEVLTLDIAEEGVARFRPDRHTRWSTAVVLEVSLGALWPEDQWLIVAPGEPVPVSKEVA